MAHKKGKIHGVKNAIRRLLTINEKLLNKEVMAETTLNKMKVNLRKDSNITMVSYLDCFRGQIFVEL